MRKRNCVYTRRCTVKPYRILKQKSLFKLICGNKMPTRCNRGFYCRSHCLLNIVVQCGAVRSFNSCCLYSAICQETQFNTLSRSILHVNMTHVSMLSAVNIPARVNDKLEQRNQINGGATWKQLDFLYNTMNISPRYASNELTTTTITIIFNCSVICV